MTSTTTLSITMEGGKPTLEKFKRRLEKEGVEISETYHDYADLSTFGERHSFTATTKWEYGELKAAAEVISLKWPDSTVDYETVWDDDDGGGERFVMVAGRVTSRGVKDWVDTPVTP